MARIPDHVTSGRLTMRSWTDADEPILSAAIAASIEHLRPWMPWIAHEPLSPFDRRAMFAQWNKEWGEGGDAVYGMWYGDTLIGGCGLHHRGGPEVLEIGYWVHAHHVRNGFATEAAIALTDTAFTLDGVDRVEIHHDKANVVSGRVPRSLGFTLLREATAPVLAPAETGVHCHWGVERNEWPGLRGRRSALGSQQPGV